MKTNARIEILGVDNIPLKCADVRELKDLFYKGNVIRYKVVNSNDANESELRRIETGTSQLNFRFNTENRDVKDEIEFMIKEIRFLQTKSRNWFDKRTRVYKNSFSFPNGFTTPLIFEQV